MYRLILLLVSALLCICVIPGAAQEPVPLEKPADTTEEDPVDIMRQADRARGSLGGVEWEVTMTSVTADNIWRASFRVQARRYDVLAVVLEPSRRKGNRLLISGGKMWFHKKTLRKPVAVSKRHKLVGLAVAGDLAADYAKDYEPTWLPDEILNEEPCYVFDLKAKTKGTTYSRIKYWITKSKRVGIKAEYYTLSGKIIKSAVMEYDNEILIDGEPHPFISRVVIKGKLMSEDATTLTFSKPILKTIPPETFDVNHLAHQVTSR